jgi:serine/threonine protein kinase
VFDILTIARMNSNKMTMLHQRRNEGGNGPVGQKNKVKTVGKYELGAALGEGTFGKVKKAIHKETKEEVAIKIIDKEKVRQQNMGVQIKREVNIMKQIGLKEKNSNVVKLYEVLASKSKIYLVLELVTGGELFDKIVKEKRFTEKKARHYFRQLVTSVELCHNMGVCHRDLKPENLLLDDEDNLKISDFGLSALYSTGEGAMISCRAQLLHTTCGTPNYVAPEVLEDKGYDGRKADIWSMGVILYVLVVGALPFDEKTLPKLFEKIQNADYPMASFISADLSNLIASILIADPKQRATTSDIKSHPWYCHEDSTSHDCKSQRRSSLSESKDLFGQHSKRCKQDSYFTSCDPNIILKIRSELEKMGFKLGDSKQNMTTKATRITSHGMIGITILALERNGKVQIEFRKGKGDIMEYNVLLDELIKKRLVGLIEDNPI